MKKFLLIWVVITFSSYGLMGECDFPENEEFHYSVRLNFIKAGKSNIKIENITSIDGHRVYHIVSKTRTTGILDKMFHIREHMESWTDCDSLFSRKFYKDVDEVNYEKTYEVNFNYRDSVAVLKNKKEKPINGLVMDWLSMIYYLRSLDLFKGQEINLTFFDNNKFKEYSAQVVGQEEVKVKAGSYYCWIIKPSEKSRENLKHKNELTIYLSIEYPKIPVKITSKAKFGTMILELKK